MIKTLKKIALLLTTVFMLAPCMAASESASQEAETTIKQIGEYMISVLSDKSLHQDQKEAKFRTMLREHFDLKAIGKFTLGRYLPRFTAAEKQFRAESGKGKSPLDRYFEDFENLIVEMYAAQFATYKDQKFSVDHSTKGPNGSVFVYSKILKDDAPPIEIAWRLFKVNGKMLVVDAIVAKVSMSMSQKREFGEFFQSCQTQKSEQIECFLKKIRAQVEHFDKLGKENARKK